MNINNVYYTYGSIGDTNNCAGRIASVEDASGRQKFSYGKLGEVTKNIRTFALPCDESPYTFVMEYEYDSWNRIQRMTYPDGEVVSYRYDKGGMLKSVTGTKNGVSYKYIDSIKYNKFELKEAVYYGNGTHAHYTYDTLQRLSHLVSYTSPASPGGAEMMQDIYYTYDSVSNITDIVNYAPQLNNGLGGRYDNHYVYDNLYRMSSAEGHWDGVSNLNYNLSMGYSKNGRVCNKVLTAGTLLNGNFSTVSYGRNYHYNTSSQKNTIIRIDGSENHDFQWDATGNMTYHHHEGENSGYDRYLCWDEENRLQGVVDDTHQSFYLYDANGERTYKLTTSERAQLINGHWNYYTVMDNATLYASPYLVVTRQGYTKHYYAENDRIASKIGMGGLTDICQCLCPDMTLQSGNQGGDPMNQLPYELADLTDCEGPEECFYDKLSLNNNHFERVMRECLESNPNVEPNTLNEALYSFRENMEEYEPDCYWYHPDHLGSSSWITYTDGSAVQHLHYLPWGEDFVDHRTTNWAARHTFSAKEKDTETGLSYFGARYYSSDLSIWLSVDPMSDKYPSTSPYVYCRNNPIILIDPNGCDDYWISQKGKIHKHKHTNANRDRFFWGKIQYNDKGQITNDFISIAKSNYTEKSFKDKSGVNNKNKSYSRYDFHNPSDAKAVYDFIQSKNPENEWSCINIVTSDVSIGIITSGGQSQLDPGSSAVFDEFKIKYKSGGFIIWESHRHNHPSGNGPSRADYETAERVRKYSPDAKFILDRYHKESINY